MVAVIYHVSWPGYDPFYYHNTGDNNGRRNFYGVNYVPWTQIDGNSGDVSSGLYNSRYNTRKNTPTDVTVSLIGTYTANNREVDVTVQAVTTDPLPAGQYRVYIILTEDDIYYDGQYGDDWHHHTMRDMFPTYAGNVVTFAGGYPQTVEASANFTLNSQYDEANCRIIGVLHNVNTKECYNATWSFLDELDASGAPTLPARMALNANYPNPFNPKTTLPISVRSAGNAVLEILSPDGRLIRSLHNGFLPEGSSDFQWDGTDNEGNAVSSGVYMARLSTATEEQSQRLVLLK